MPKEQAGRNDGKEDGPRPGGPKDKDPVPPAPAPKQDPEIAAEVPHGSARQPGEASRGIFVDALEHAGMLPPVPPLMEQFGGKVGSVALGLTYTPGDSHYTHTLSFGFADAADSNPLAVLQMESCYGASVSQEASLGAVGALGFSDKLPGWEMSAYASIQNGMLVTQLGPSGMSYAGMSAAPANTVQECVAATATVDLSQVAGTAAVAASAAVVAVAVVAAAPHVAAGLAVAGTVAASVLASEVMMASATGVLLLLSRD